MLNTFINTTTYGQAMAATFNLDTDGSTLAEMRITSIEDCNVLDPIYEKEVRIEKVAEYLKNKQTQKVSNLGKAVETENIRVNSLAILIRELELINTLDTEECVTIYVPQPLLQEIQSGRIRYYLNENTNSYFSEVEIELWKEALPLMHELYFRLVFKSIDACKTNNNNDQIQALRISIVNSMYARLLKAFKERKASMTGVTVAGTQVGEIFA